MNNRGYDPNRRPGQNGARIPQGQIQRPQAQRPPQRPAGQRPAQVPPKRPPQAYDPHLIEEARRRRRDAEIRERQRKREARAAVFIRAVIILLVYAVLCASLVLFFIWKLAYTNPLDSAKHTYIYGDVTVVEPYTVATTEGGDVMVNFTRIAALCSMTSTGDSSELRYITIDENTENVRFVVGTNIVYMNGMQDRMDGVCRIIGNDLWVPITFVTDFMTGISAEVDEKAHKITVTRNELPTSTEESPEYEPVGYRIKNYSAIEAVSEESAIEAEKNGQSSNSGGKEELNFIKDLSAYEKYMNPEGDEYLTLINYENLLSSDYVPNDLIDVVNTRADRSKARMREYAEKALEALYIEMYANGYTDVTVTSGYRSYQDQKNIHNSYIARELEDHPGWTWDQAKAEVLTYSAEPGTSEHQSGLCVDMHNLASADKSFANQDAYTWLKNNAHKFGFILRYPEDKTEITKIDFEPWHYRYVGRYHATKMYESGMCLEEYVASLNK